VVFSSEKKLKIRRLPFQGKSVRMYLNPINSRNLMHPENREYLLHSLDKAFPQTERAILTPEQIDGYTLECRIWALQEPEAFEEGVAEVINHFASPDSEHIAIHLMKRYSLLQIAWMTQEAARRCL
jgi:hypothetical protein